MRKGFTLIELLVVIAIVGLLMSISAAAIFSARNKRTAKTAADQVKNVIMEAHAYAISPKTTALDGSTVTGPVNIVIAANSIKAQVGNKDIIQPVTIPSNVTLSCWNGATAVTPPAPCLSFNMGKADGSDSSTIGQTTVNYIRATKKGTNEQYTVKVGHLSGNVTITTP